MSPSAVASPPSATRRSIERPPRSFGRLFAGLAAVTALASGALALDAADPAGAAGVIHVAPAGSDSGNGSAAQPVRTVDRAVKLASAGDQILIAAGTYHEQVQVYGKEVHIAAAPGARVVFDGAVPVQGWAAADGDWSAPWTTNFERSGEPHTLPEAPQAGWPEQFFVDGTQLTEVTSRAAVVPGTFFNDIARGRVWIGDDPAGRLVEGSELPWALYLNKADGSSITGIVARRYATPISNMAAIRAYANNLTLTDVTVENNAYIGVSAIGANITFDRLTARYNGHLGAHSHRTTGLAITNCTIVGNNAAGFNFHHAAGGFKVTESTGITVTGCTVSGNAGPGVWTDLSTSNIVIANNLIQNNLRSGIMLELSSAATVVNNVSTNNRQAGIWVLESQDVHVWHNAAFQNFRDFYVLTGPRADVRNVAAMNNTFGGGAAGAQTVMSVDDWTEKMPTAAMNIAMSDNQYWLPEGAPTRYVSRFAQWPSRLSLSTTIEQHRNAAGLDAGAALSRATTNPFVRDAAAGDFRQPTGAQLGAPIPAGVAAIANVAAGVAYPAGPISALFAPTPTPPPVNPEDTSTDTTSSTTTGSSASLPAGSTSTPGSSTTPDSIAPAVRLQPASSNGAVLATDAPQVAVPAAAVPADAVPADAAPAVAAPAAPASAAPAAPAASTTAPAGAAAAASSAPAQAQLVRELPIGWHELAAALSSGR